MLSRTLLPAALPAVLVLATLAATPLPASAAEVSTTVTATDRVDGLLVQYDEGTDPDILDGLLPSALITATDLADGGPVGFDTDLVEFAEPLTLAVAEQAAQQVEGMPGITFAEPNYVYSVEGDASQSANSGKGSSSQSSPVWGLDRIHQRSTNLDGKYIYDTTGAGVTAYIIDTGVRLDHKEFTGRITSGYNALKDGRSATDCNGHGTHVAGTLAGTTYGVAKKATVVPVRVLDCEGRGAAGSVLGGLNWVLEDHEQGEPAVANISLGGAASASFDRAVQALVDDGITVVVSSGNFDDDACDYSPARVADAITVSASDREDERWVNSDYGPCTDLYAPGVKVTSAGIGSTTDSLSMTGTSMAAPHVAGVAARILSADPDLTPAQVATAISSKATAVDFSSKSGDPAKLLYAPAPQSFTKAQAPTIEGTATVGHKLTATAGTTSPAAKSTYQWKRSGSVISGATSSTYTLTGADAGKTITVTTVASRSDYASATRTSTATRTVAQGTITPAKNTTTKGSSTEGRTLTAVPGTWVSGVKLSYQWKRSGANITGATGSTYRLTASDIGKKITVTVRATKTGYKTAYAQSRATPAVARASR